MGRTSRRRKRKTTSSISLDDDPSIINLKKWMKTKNWLNLNSLQLRTFSQTGRGLSAATTILPKDVLIEIPYELIVSSATLDSSTLNEVILLSGRKNLQIHDALSAFLVFELHQGSSSEWYHYISSLPATSPALPWLCSSEELKLLPQNILSAALAKLNSFEESWTRVKYSINPTWTCSCCQNSSLTIFDKTLFTWAYVMVNTRSVYLNPDIVRKLSGRGPSTMSNFTYHLSDEPSMALCPFLDMFNHSNAAETETKLERVNGKWAFSLISLTEYEKGKEVFISYGKHMNAKLLLEYGFFIPDDDLMEVSLTLQEILGVAKISLNGSQYKFIRQKGLDANLSVAINGLSFNLKAALFVLLNPSAVNWCSVIFSDGYTSEDMFKMSALVERVISAQATKLSADFNGLKLNLEGCSGAFLIVANYLEYELSFMLRLLNNFVNIVNGTLGSNGIG